MTEPHVPSSFETERLLFREVVYPDGYDMPAHEHDIDCVVLLLQGGMSGALEDETFEASGSSLLFLPAFRPHATRAHGELHTFDVVLSPDYSDEYREFLSRDHMAVRDSGEASAVAARMHRELLQPDHATQLILEGLALELLGRLARPAVRVTARPRWLATAVDFIHAHLSGSISLAEVAAEAKVHPAHLTRVFRQHFGCTIGDYSRKVRLDRACAALAKDDRSLAGIAFDAGFSDQSHFSRAFKAHTGSSPGQYRRMQLRSNGMQL